MFQGIFKKIQKFSNVIPDISRKREMLKILEKMKNHY